MATYTVVSSFTDPSNARAAAGRLTEHGFASDRIGVHSQPAVAPNADGVTLDEVVTGGFFHSFMGMLDGLFGTANPTHKASSYAEVVRQGGSVVLVDTTDEEEADRALVLLRDAGATEQTIQPRA